MTKEPPPLTLAVRDVEQCPNSTRSRWAKPHILATVTINEVPHHLVLFPVKEETSLGHTYQAAEFGYEEWYRALEDIDQETGNYQTIEINGRPHVALLTPFMR